jgi:hypothetical protein
MSTPMESHAAETTEEVSRHFDAIVFGTGQGGLSLAAGFRPQVWRSS